MPMKMASFTFGGMDNVAAPSAIGKSDPNTRGAVYDVCADLVNVDVGLGKDLSRRKGFVLSAAGSVTSAWSDGAKAYCVKGGTLHRFNGVFTALADSPLLTDPCEFVRVNDIVVFSDGTTLGYIKADDSVVLVGPEDDLSDLAAWAAANWPSETKDTFKVTTTPGRCLEFYGGALYFAVGNFVYRTCTFDIEHMDTRFNVVAGFAAPVTMVKGVDGGLLIGTETEVVFVKTELQKGNQDQVLNVGAIYGSAVTVSAEVIPALKSQGDGVLFATPLGIFACAGEGKILNLSERRVRIPSAARATAYVSGAGDIYRYVYCAAPDAVCVNLATAHHSRYTNYGFAALFELGAAQYAANASGVFTLTGETDAGTPINASVVLPTVTFDALTKKVCPEAVLLVRGGEMTVDLSVDEVEVATDLEVRNTEEPGLTRRRAKLPRKAKGISWTFTVRNVAGADFYLAGVDAVYAATQRTL